MADRVSRLSHNLLGWDRREELVGLLRMASLAVVSDKRGVLNAMTGVLHELNRVHGQKALAEGEGRGLRIQEQAQAMALRELRARVVGLAEEQLIGWERAAQMIGCRLHEVRTFGVRGG